VRRLRQGLRVAIGLERSVVIDIEHGAVRVLSVEDAAALEALAVGADSTWQAPSALDDLLEPRADPVDAVVRARLGDLDRAVYADAATDARTASALTAVERAHARRACVNRVLGQRPALPETAVRRALVSGAAAGDVLVLGDDDFTGLALAALGARSVTIHDLDRHLLDLHAVVASEAGVACALVEHDLREPMPAAARAAFGAVHVTLPDGVEGMTLVLSRAATCLAPGGLVVASVSPTALPALTPVLVRSGLVLEHHAPGFHRYYTLDGRLDPGARDLVCVRGGPRATPLIAHDQRCLPDRLYAPEPGAPPALSYTIEEIEDPRYTGAVFLQMLLERVEGLPPGLLADTGAATAFATLLPDRGFVLLQADRERRVLQALVSPLGAPPQKPLLALLHAAHKPDAQTVDIVADARCFRARTR
jgi:hypothetical protein